ncbi:uncharacterized protein LOC143022510 [Oratosquilla oratoria]|uniref:uncharacterized protein LOC143022510 n=1 Tax=Oratosquilla oratoria TaxID=337810 RepID=UPI003F76A8DC
MHYLDLSYKAYQRAKRYNKYAVKKVKDALKKKNDRRPVKEETPENLSGAPGNDSQQFSSKLEAEKLNEDRAREILQKTEERVSKREMQEEKNVLDKLRKERSERHLKEPDSDQRETVREELLGFLRENSVQTFPHHIGQLGDFKYIKDGTIRELYEGKTVLSERFLKHINGFNLVFSFTSFATSSKLENAGEKALCYKIQGRVYHRLGSLKPGLLKKGSLTGKDVHFDHESNSEKKPFWRKNNSFLDLYFYHEKDHQIKLRTLAVQHFSKSENGKGKMNKTEKRRAREEKVLSENEKIITHFYEYMAKHNACLSGMLKELETAKQLMEAHVKKYGKLPQVSITLKAAENLTTREHKGVYHLPTSSSQVGAIVNSGPSRDPLEIVIGSPKEDSKFSLRLMSHTNFFYDVFQYPLLFPNGDVGHSCTLKKQRKADICCSKHVPATYSRLSPCMYYASLYMEREGVFNYVTKGARLFQQFVVDNYVKVESDRLSFIEHNQQELRKERADILIGDGDNRKAGQRVIIHASFVGGPRYMKARQQDALAFVSSYGSPDFFITFTMNPHWEELKQAVEAVGCDISRMYDRPDFVCRIFKLKVDILMDDLTIKNVFGRVKAHLLSIEWQKRGLPHVHILLWMERHVTADFVSRVISGEIPDKNKEPRLNEIVTTNMIHGPCRGFDESQLCCQGKYGSTSLCGKGFPKVCRGDMYFGNNGYPLYRRTAVSEGGHSFEKKVKGEKIKVDNSWVVPYSPYQCLKYNTHINVECSNSIKCIAYVTKYVNKGCDRILFSKTKEGEDVNEVRKFQEARFVNANEASWKIFKFAIHRSHPPVATLDLHLEGENAVFFKENASKEIDRKTSKDTHLKAFFKIEAVKAIGLLNDKETWKKTILEIINHTNDRNQLRAIYASMLVFSELEDQSGIWEETKDLFASDFLQRQKATEYNDEIYLDALDDIQEHVWNCGGGYITQYGLPLSRCGEKTSNIIRREKACNKEKLTEEVKEKSLLLNSKQRLCYDTVLFRIENAQKYRHNGIFLDAPGGTGKSFVLNILLDTVRSQGKIALAVASSGIASTVLHGGRTAHNMFKIPLMDYNEVCACSIKKNSELAKLLSMTSLIVWDEVVMANKNTLATLDVSLRDILGVPGRFMGGILELTRNVRLKADDAKNKIFAKNLLALGRGESGPVKLPEKFGIVVETRKELVDKVYDNLEENHLNASYFEKRAIISPTNDDVDRINLMVYDKSEEPEKVYMSVDTAMEEVTDIQTSVFNAITSPSPSSHVETESRKCHHGYEEYMPSQVV